jgi:nucleoside-diphosphate-sugar epimerase
LKRKREKTKDKRSENQWNPLSWPPAHADQDMSIDGSKFENETGWKPSYPNFGADSIREIVEDILKRKREKTKDKRSENQWNPLSWPPAHALITVHEAWTDQSVPGT